MDSENTKTTGKNQSDKEKEIKALDKHPVEEHVTDVEVCEDVRRINPDSNSMESRG